MVKRRFLGMVVGAVITLLFFQARTTQAAIGDFLYKWGAPYEFVAPQSIAVDDTRGLVYVGDTGTKYISVYTKAGAFVRRQAPSTYAAPNYEKQGPRSVAVSPVTGWTYAIYAYGGMIAVFDEQGSFRKWFGSEGPGDGQFYYPNCVAVNAAGEIHVADGWNRNVQVFDAEGTFLRKWRAPRHYYFYQVLGMAFDGSGNLFLSDYITRMLYIFSPSGIPINAFREDGFTPSGLAIDGAAGELYVVNQSRPGIDVYSLGTIMQAPFLGSPLRTVGSEGPDAGDFGWANGLSLSADGTLFVAIGDSYGVDNSRVKLFDKMGAFRAVWRAKGTEPGRFAFPTSIAVDAAGKVLVADNGNRRVQAFTAAGALTDGGFALDPGCQTLGIETGANGSVFLEESCLVDGVTDVFIKAYGPGGALQSNWPITGRTTWGGGFAVTDGRVFVADGTRILVFDLNGALLGVWGAKPGFGFNTWVRNVTDVEIGPDGLLVAVDGGDVITYDATGHSVRMVTVGWGPRTFALDPCGNIFGFPSNYNNYPPTSVVAYDRNGLNLANWGSDGIWDGQFRAASGIAADNAGRVFVVERDNHRVQVFEGSRACGQPVAAAGADRATHPGRIETLDGSASVDPAGQPLSYSWRLASVPAGSAAVLTGALSPTPSLTTDRLGEYVIELVVTSAYGFRSEPDQLVLTATNEAPTANAGPDQAVLRVGTWVQLAGSTFDPDGDPLTIRWEFASLPAGSAATLSDPGAPLPTFVADLHGSYLLNLTVSDPWGGTATDSVEVSFANVVPVADAGLAQSVLQGALVRLDGSGSSDANGDMLTYSWQMVMAPEGTAAELFGPQTAAPSFIADLPGQFALTLVVGDGFAESSPALVTVTAVSYQDALTSRLSGLLALVNGFPDAAFANATLRGSLGNKINAVINQVEKGDFSGALNKLRNDLLPKMDGCALGEASRVNDWVTICDEQAQAYRLLLEAVEILAPLAN